MPGTSRTPTNEDVGQQTSCLVSIGRRNTDGMVHAKRCHRDLVSPLKVAVFIDGTLSGYHFCHFPSHAVFPPSETFGLCNELLQSKRPRPAGWVATFNECLKFIFRWQSVSQEGCRRGMGFAQGVWEQELRQVFMRSEKRRLKTGSFHFVERGR